MGAVEGHDGGNEGFTIKIILHDRGADSVRAEIDRINPALWMMHHKGSRRDDVSVLAPYGNGVLPKGVATNTVELIAGHGRNYGGWYGAIVAVSAAGDECGRRAG